MLDASAVSTPMADKPPLTKLSGTSLHDSTEYRMVIGSHQYLLFFFFLNYTQFPQRLPRPKGLICVAAARMLNFAVAGNRTQVAVLTAVNPLPPELDAPVHSPSQYLLFTLPDIAFAVNKLSQYMHNPTTDHWIAAKRILWYLCGSRDRGLFFSTVNTPQLHAYSDADWAGDKDD